MREEVTSIRLEGLAAWGRVRDVGLEECGKEKARVVARLVDGREVVTPCMELGAAGRTILVVKQYAERWARLIVTG